MNGTWNVPTIFDFCRLCHSITIINDTHGHSTGGDVLRFIGVALKERIGEAMMTRYGGDEFAVSMLVGAAIMRADGDAECWFGRSDKLLYNANASGRNRAMVESKHDLQ